MNAKDQKDDFPDMPEDQVAASKRLERRRLTLPFRIFLALLLTMTVIFLGGYLFYVWWLAEPENVRSFAESKLAPLFPGKTVTVGAADFSLLTGLELFQVTVTDEQTGLDVVRLNHVHVDFYLGRITRPTLLIRNVVAEDLFVDLVRDSDGHWNLTLPEPPEEIERNPFATPLSISLRGAFVSVDDQYGEYAVSFPVSRASAFCADERLESWRASIDMGGGLLGEWLAQAEWNMAERWLSAELRVMDIDIGKGLRTRIPVRARQVYDRFEPFGLADVDGVVSFNDADGWKWRLDTLIKEAGGRFHRFPVRGSGFEGRASFTQDGVDFFEIAGEGSGGEVSVSVVTRGYGREAAVEAWVEASDVEVSHEIMEALPANVRRVVDEFSPRGTAHATVEVKRPSGPEMPYDIAMVLEPAGMRVSYDMFPLELHNATGRITYADNTVTVSDFTARRAQMQVFVSGTVGQVDTAPSLNMRVVTTSVPLVEEIRSLLPEGPGEFWNELNPSGSVDTEVIARKRPDEDLSLSINTSLRDVSVNYDGFPLPLSNGQGEFAVVDGIFSSTDGITFQRGGGTVSIAGRADTATGEADLEINARTMTYDRELESAMPGEWQDRLAPLGLAGLVDTAISLKRDHLGQVDLVDMRAQLSHARLRPDIAPLGIAAERASLAYTPDSLDVLGLEGWLFPDNAAVLLPFARLGYLARPPTNISATGGVIAAEDGHRWEIGFDARNLFVDAALLQGLPANLSELLREIETAGLMDVRGRASESRLDDARETSFSISADCRGLSLVAGADFSRVHGHINLTGSIIDGDVRFVGRGDLESLILDRRPLSGTGFVFEKTADRVLLHEIQTVALGGTLMGSGHFGIENARGYAFSVAFRDLALDTMLKEMLNFEREGLRGKMTGSLDVASSTGASADIIGRCDAVITEGALWEVPVVLAIFHVLNLRIPERAQFTEARLRSEVARDTILVREFSLASDPATIFGEGQITFDGKVDMTFYSHPGRIPIVSILAGELGKQIIRARLTGSFEDPRVTIVPSGPFGIFLEFLRAPFRRGGS